jgi:hypothetical protein
MNEQINQRVVRITKDSCIDKDLQVGNGYVIKATVHCQKGGDLEDNHDGTFNKHFQLQLQGEFEILNDLGQKITAKVKNSWSKKWKFLVEQRHNYDEFMAKQLSHAEEIIDFIEKL